MKKILLAIAVLGLVTACNDGPDPTLELASELQMEAGGGSQTFAIETNTDWILATDGATWYSVSPTSGSGSATITVTAQPYTEAAARSSQITVTGGGLIKTLALIQNRPAVPAKASEYEYTIKAYEQDITVPAPQGFTYKVVIPSTADGIVSLVAAEKDSLTLHFATNNTAESRSLDIAIKTTDDLDLEKVSIEQSWMTVLPGELLIDEIFFAGNASTDSKSSDSGDGDQYFKLTNNSDNTIYADGVIIAMSETYSQVTATGASWTYPDLPDGVGVSSLYVIPGSGKDVAIAPGKSIVLALAAQNFKSENGYGFDLSGADFEFYDENDWYPDTDNPDVKNMTLWFKSSFTLTTLHNRGYESYAIAVAPIGTTMEQFMEEHPWEGQRVFTFRGNSISRDITDAYVIPNTWVLDAVNCAVDENLGTLAFNSTVDAGYTNVSTIDSDPDRYGKSVARIRKDAKLVDTNNSTNDFEILTSPSMK